VERTRATVLMPRLAPGSANPRFVSLDWRADFRARRLVD
jgi:hypothetical protein